MGWRENLLTSVGPGNFAGITFGDWLSLLRDNRWSVSPTYLPRAASIFLQCIPNTVLRRLEEARFQCSWDAVTVPPPLFILGHYRHGTTHLQNLLSIDERFAFPNLYQVSFPHTFLTTERAGAKLLNYFVPASRPFDNIRLGMDVPAEDELAMIMSAGVSPYLTGVFPRRAAHYDRHLSLREASASELCCWKEALLLFLKKLTFKYGKPLVVKSPTHTARIRLLLEMFPKAKFVHIHRNPFDVFRSTLKMVTTASPWFRLQSDQVDWTERTLRVYREMYDVFFEERSLIPSGNFYEIGYDELTLNPIQELRSMYDRLNLPLFSDTEQKLRRYIDSISCYKPNQFASLTKEETNLVATQWHRSFGEWGYGHPEDVSADSV